MNPIELIEQIIDESYAMVAVTVQILIEAVVAVAVYGAMLVGGWFLLGWLARWLFGG